MERSPLYDYEYVDENFDSHPFKYLFSCSICCSPFVDPVRFKCSHTFCRHCILKSSNLRDSYPCPLCQIPLMYNEGIASQDSTLLHILGGLEVHCTKKTHSGSIYNIFLYRFVHAYP